MNDTCGDTFTGLFEGITLHCVRPTGHGGAHEDPQLGTLFSWTNNSYRFAEATA